ncbi:hypothetical protein [Haloferax profundi]|uniref:Uncharacterized protein n=1 Tax=Haloferax profundi TaxID=1544718 RepID=A0A0W1R2N9_9EURY|nr:hypothetical protein [Haloferax profundi]KTG07551.1 hypothetical protein AUR66_05055 [Haloferax profundi]
MAVEQQTLMRFLQLIILTITALIYIGQSILRGKLDSNDGSPFPEDDLKEAGGLFLTGLIFITISGVASSIYLIPMLAFKEATTLQFWLVNSEILPNATKPIYLLFMSSGLAVITYRSALGKSKERASVYIGIVLLFWLHAAFSTAVAYSDWVPLFITGTFALGVSLFFIALVRLSFPVFSKL